MTDIAPKTNPKANLGFITLTALVVGNMIGGGIFLLPASLASFGTISILGWVLTGIGSIFLALLFANLSRRLPFTGGPYVYAHEGFGNFMGFLIAYNYWIALWVGNAAVAVTLAGYLGVFWPALNADASGAYNPLLAFAVKAGSVWLFTWINIMGVRGVGRIQIITTLLKISPLLIICFFGLTKIQPIYLTEFNLTGESNWTALSGAATLTLWAFIGLESATVPAEEAKRVSDISRATICGTLIAAVIYILSTITIMGLIPDITLRHSTAPFADAATLLFGPKMQWVIAATAIISCVGALNGWILLQGQVPMAAARDGLFPRIFAKLGRNGTPVAGQIISSCFITVLLILTINTTLVKQFTFIVLLATLAFLIPYFISAMAELMLLLKSKEPSQKLIKPAIIASIAGIYSFWTIIGAGKEVVFYGTLLFFSGIPVYIWLQWRKKKFQQDEQPLSVL